MEPSSRNPAGQWMLRELREHGCRVSREMLYPLLCRMENPKTQEIPRQAVELFFQESFPSPEFRQMMAVS